MASVLLSTCVSICPHWACACMRVRVCVWGECMCVRLCLSTLIVCVRPRMHAWTTLTCALPGAMRTVSPVLLNATSRMGYPPHGSRARNACRRQEDEEQRDERDARAREKRERREGERETKREREREKRRMPTQNRRHTHTYAHKSTLKQDMSIHRHSDTHTQRETLLYTCMWTSMEAKSQRRSW